jgi:hypothetical protein
MRALLAQAATNRLLAVLVKAVPTLQTNLTMVTRGVVDTTKGLRIIEQHVIELRRHTIQGLAPLAELRALLPHLRTAKQSCVAYGSALDAAIEALERP